MPVGEMLVHAVRNEKLRILGPAIKPLGEANLFFAERFAMGRGCIVLVRRAIPDMAVENDKRWAALGLLEDLQRVFDKVGVVGVAYAQDIPAVGQKPAAISSVKAMQRVAFDGDVVVVVDPAQIIQLQMAGERRGLRRDAFHHVAVAANDINPVIEDVEARPVIPGSQPFSAMAMPTLVATPCPSGPVVASTPEVQ